jgi:hypothetical protein
MNYGQNFSYIEETYQQLKRVKSVSHSMSYVLLRGSWCSIVLDVRAPKDYEVDDAKGSFCEEPEHVSEQFFIEHKKILIGYLNAKLDRKDIFKPTTGNES